MNQDIQSYKMKYSHSCIYLTYWFKSIKDSWNINTNETDYKWNWLSKSTPYKNIMQCWIYKKYYFKINIFYFEK